MCDSLVPIGFHTGDINTILLLTCTLQAYQLCCFLWVATAALGITILCKTTAEHGMSLVTMGYRPDLRVPGHLQLLSMLFFRLENPILVRIKGKGAHKKNLVLTQGNWSLVFLQTSACLANKESSCSFKPMCLSSVLYLTFWGTLSEFLASQIHQMSGEKQSSCLVFIEKSISTSALLRPGESDSSLPRACTNTLLTSPWYV